MKIGDHYEDDPHSMRYLIPQIGDGSAYLVYRFGYTTMSKLAAASITDLENIPGIGKKRLAGIVEAIRAYERDYRAGKSDKIIEVEFGGRY